MFSRDRDDYSPSILRVHQRDILCASGRWIVVRVKDDERQPENPDRRKHTPRHAKCGLREVEDISGPDYRDALSTRSIP